MQFAPPKWDDIARDMDMNMVALGVMPNVLLISKPCWDMMVGATMYTGDHKGPCYKTTAKTPFGELRVYFEDRLRLPARGYALLCSCPIAGVDP